MQRKHFAWIFVAFALFVSACSEGTTSEECPPDRSIGITRCNTAENFTAQNWDRAEVSLTDFRGKPVFLNFWASWCNPCKVEMPLMEDVYQQYAGEMHMLAVNILDEEAPARTFFENGGFSYTFLYKDKDSIANQYLIRYVPQTMFISPDGIILGHIPGSPDWSSEACQDLVKRFVRGGNSPLPQDMLQ